MKIYRRLRTWIMIVVLIALIATVSILIKQYGPKQPVGDEWKAEIEQQIERNQMSMERMPDAAISEVKRQNKLNQYRLDNNIAPAETTLWQGVLNASNLIILIAIFTVIIGGDIVAGEFSGGTIKLLMIRPASRSKILLSKYIAMLNFSTFLLILLFIVALVINGLLYGVGQVDIPHLKLNDEGNVVETNMVLHVLGVYALNCVQLVMVVTLAFMISSVFRSSSLAIGLSMFVMFITPQLTVILIQRFTWLKYFLFANTDLTMYLEGRPLLEEMTMGFSIAVLVVYFVIMNGLSWLLFTKRDVAA